MSAAVTVDTARFTAAVQRFAAAAQKDIHEEWRNQGRLLAASLVKLTPPFKGKQIASALKSQGKVLSDPAMENASALKIGKNAVERDFKKLFVPVRKWDSVKEGKNFVRLFGKGGLAYGVPKSFYESSPSAEWLSKIRAKYRTKRGKVMYNVNSAQQRGKWVNVMKYPVPTALYKDALKAAQSNVGRGKGGWAKSFIELGGRLSTAGWVGKHASKTGSCRHNLKGWNIDILMRNFSEWAQAGDPDRVMAAALAGRENALASATERVLEKKWRKG